MGFSFSKLFNTKTSKTPLKSNDSIEAIISDVENTPFGISQNNVLYAGLNELGGYYFFQTVIVGAMHLKTRKGAQLLLNGKDIALELQSDMLELESDHSDISKRSITKIDFHIEENDIETLQKTRITDIQLKVKSYDIIFRKYETQDEEE